jgi:drug/metabolite transporter (DMT)-like permease
MEIKWYLISIFLSFVYTFYIVFSQTLSNLFLKPQHIFVNVIIIASIISIILYPQYIIKPSFTKEYIIIFIIGILIVLQNYLLQLGTFNKINIALIDSFAIAIYLILLTLIMCFFFKEKLSAKKITGILLVSVSVYLILS